MLYCTVLCYVILSNVVFCIKLYFVLRCILQIYNMYIVL